jgi:hypothetical protein
MVEVFFSLDFPPQRIKAEYDRSLLHLGALVHVVRTPQGTQFHPHPINGSKAFAVTWIAPSEWYVTLADGLVIPESSIQRMMATVKGLASEVEIKRACARCSDLMPVQELYLTSARERNPLNQLMTVVDRLELVERISYPEYAKQLADQYEPLVVYLMLTCFDRLGQPADWIDFSSWLNSKEAKEASSSTASPPIDHAKHLYRQWSAKYGVRNSFYRFMDEVVPSSTISALLDSIHIDVLSNPPNINSVVADSAAKKAWLYETRNRFTHTAQILRGFHPDHFGTTRSGLERKETRFGKKTWQVCDVEAWPARVIETVRHGLAATIAKLAVAN